MEKNNLPNATAVLVLGICSIIGCCCYGVGLIPGIIGLVLAKKDTKEYRENPDLYSNYGNLNAGRILCIIGVSISVIYLLMIAYMLIVLGPDGMENLRIKLEEMQRNQQ